MKRLLTMLVMSCIYTITGMAQNGKLSGTVTDQKNNPLAGASISVNGKIVTKTNEQGVFTLPCNGNKQEISISFIGYKKWLQTANCGETLHLVLEEKVNQLADVAAISNASSRKNLLEQPVSIVQLRETELKRGNGLYFDDAINNNTPGIIMQRRSNSGGQQFNIRGYGNGIGVRGVNGNFDSQGSKTYFNGIPVTDAEGITVMDDIDFASLENAEIQKGPSGTLYGLAIAGVINLQTQKAAKGQSSISQDFLSGSYGLLRSTTRLSIGGNNHSLLINYGHQKFDGYMAHTAARKDFMNLVGDITINQKESLSVYLGYSNSYDERNGELTKQQYESFDYSGNPAYIKNNAHSAVTGIRAGITHNYQFNDRISNTTSLFGSAQSTDQSSAGGWTDKNPVNYGFRSVFTTVFPLSHNSLLTGITGIEVQKMHAITLGYNMGTDNTNPGGYNVITSVRSDQATSNSTSTLFTQWTLELPKGLSVAAGVGMSQQRLKLDDRLWGLTNNTAGNTKQKVYANSYKNLFAPSFSIIQKIGNTVSVYAGYSSAYKAPVSANILIATTGQLNTGLQPEKGTQWEVGTKGNLLGGKLFYTLAFFDAKFQNKFTAVAVPNPANTATLYTYIVNAGTLNNKGIEMLVKYSLVQSEKGFVRMVRPFANITFSDFNYGNYQYQRIGKDRSNKDSLIIENYTGKQVAGTPPLVLNLGIDAALQNGLYGNIQYHYRSGMAYTSDGINRTHPFNQINSKIGYKKTWKHFEIDLFAGANNITGQQSYYMVFVNQLPDAYLPAPNKANYFGGINLKYQF